MVFEHGRQSGCALEVDAVLQLIVEMGAVCLAGIAEEADLFALFNVLSLLDDDRTLFHVREHRVLIIPVVDDH